MFKKSLWLIGVLALGMVTASPTQAAESKDNQETGLVIRTDRLEQQGQQNKSQASRLAKLFDPEDVQKLQTIQEQTREDREKAVDRLFQETVSGAKDLDADALFAQSDTKVVYSQSGQETDSGHFALIFYGVLATVVLGSFVYISYLFLKG